ncbi:UbiE/COQ5 methyltransferase [Aspergillus steynii IBT 23096]|uniref:UbiE/COQ5 methyltransferase n=1 Tax=Aspergillus steynii IBT 23096 TaxID=1392250 RepID=A0A2I2FW51_9EURO|nr:UbiE/COQ5 methyltransferase [Aspergillus steynii IBT 23096]PLB44861.1 UbiE/COQ5 methyltransferase [Aspergillus steynii IBT 23096]
MPTYTTNHAPSVLQTHSWRTATNSAAYLLPYIQPGMKILDIGCGPGSISLDFARLVTPTGHVTGVEYSPDPLATARGLAASQGVDNITFRVGDIHNLSDFADGSFDIVHVHQVLQHIADPVLALREMRRLAKPTGGIVAARESASLSWFPPNEGIEAWDGLTRRVARAKGGNPHPGSWVHVWAEEAGFARDRVRRSAGAWCFSTPEERAYWGGSMAERMRGSGFAEMVVAEGFAGEEDLRGMERGWRGFVDCPHGWFGGTHEVVWIGGKLLVEMNTVWFVAPFSASPSVALHPGVSMNSASSGLEPQEQEGHGTQHTSAQSISHVA